MLRIIPEVFVDMVSCGVSKLLSLHSCQLLCGSILLDGTLRPFKGKSSDSYYVREKGLFIEHLQLSFPLVTEECR